MMELLAHLAGDCAIWDARHPGVPRCGAFRRPRLSRPAPGQANRGDAGAPASSKMAANGAWGAEEERLCLFPKRRMGAKPPRASAT